MNQIKIGAALNYVIIGLNTLVGLLYTPYMLRMLGQNDYGLYSLVASVIAYLTILDFGFGNAIIRYTAKFRAERKQREQWEMFGMFLIVYSVIGLIAFAGGLALYYNVDTLFDRTMTAADTSQARIMMLLLTLNLLVTFPLSIFGSIITAYENFIFQRGVNIIRIILSTAVMIAMLAIGFKAIAGGGANRIQHPGIGHKLSLLPTETTYQSVVRAFQLAVSPRNIALFILDFSQCNNGQDLLGYRPVCARHNCRHGSRCGFFRSNPSAADVYDILHIHLQRPSSESHCNGCK